MGIGANDKQSGRNAWIVAKFDIGQKPYKRQILTSWGIRLSSFNIYATETSPRVKHSENLLKRIKRLLEDIPQHKYFHILRSQNEEADKYTSQVCQLQARQLEINGDSGCRNLT